MLALDEVSIAYTNDILDGVDCIPLSQPFCCRVCLLLSNRQQPSQMGHVDGVHVDVTFNDPFVRRLLSQILTLSVVV